MSFNDKIIEIKHIAERLMRPDQLAGDKWANNLQFKTNKKTYSFDELTETVLDQTKSIVVFRECPQNNISMLIKRAVQDDTTLKGAFVASKYQLKPQHYAQCIPKLSHLGAKGVGGRPLLVVGSQKYHGAAILCALACSRAGSDYTYLLTHGNKLNVISQASPDIITSLHDDLDPDYVKKLPCTSILIGSGLDRNDSAQKVFFDIAEIAPSKEKPFIVDADGLHFLGVVMKTRPDVYVGRKYPIILTPNAREFASLFGKIFNEEPLAYQQCFEKACIQGKYITIDLEAAVQCVKRLADKIDCCVLVKNMVDICCYKGQVRITRNLGMVKRASGQGDVLAGVIACLVNWGNSVINQVIISCEIVKISAQKAFAKKRLGTVAADIISEIPEVIYQMAPENLMQYEMLWE